MGLGRLGGWYIDYLVCIGLFLACLFNSKYSIGDTGVHWFMWEDDDSSDEGFIIPVVL